MRDLLDLDRYSIDRPDSPECAWLAERCQADLTALGMFNLEGFVRAEAIARAVSEVEPLMDSAGSRPSTTPCAPISWQARWLIGFTGGRPWRISWRARWANLACFQ
jgi:hypothetical protein